MSVPYNAKDLMSDAKFFEAYARYDEDKGRYETWEEAIDRVMSMHKVHLKKRNVLSDEVLALLDEAAESYKNKDILGAQRALQFGGKQLLAKHPRLYNCAASYCDRPEFFGEAFHLMLCGTGVGFSVQKQHIAKLPKIAKRKKPAKTFVIPDSIEGWANAVDVLLSSFFVGGGKFPEYEGNKIYFDFSKIRPKGAKISGGFKAPGPEALQYALAKVELLIKAQLDAGLDSLKSIVAYDIVMFIADAVISGGVRRSATICLFSFDDEDMIKAKTGDWFDKNPQRGRSNNSAVLLRDSIQYDVFKQIMQSVKDSGEPGFIFSDDLEALFNPCVTKDTLVTTSTGTYPVSDLIGKQFTAVVNGKEYPTSEKGFWYTGTKAIFKLTTREGYELKLTDNHKLLTNNGWKEVKDITDNDKISIHKHENYSWGSTDDFDKGWLLGNLVGDGTFTEDSAILKYWDKEIEITDYVSSALNKHCKLTKEFITKTEKETITYQSKKLKELANSYGIIQRAKTPSIMLEQESSSFYSGYLSGLFDADGSVQGTNKKGVSIRLTQNNLDTLKQAQRMLLKLGITSKIYKNRRAEGYYELPDGKGSSKMYLCNSVHELMISRDSLRVFSERVGFKVKHKQDTLNSLLAKYKKPLYKSNFYCNLENLEYLGEEDVYDVTVDTVHAFDANGIFAHNCVEIGMRGYTEDGRSGWQMCNLTEINGGKSDTPQKFYRQCKAAAILGTIQASYTEFNFLGAASREIIEKEALIGVGVTGWMNNPEVLFNEEVMKKGAEVVKYWNKKTAELIGINQAARTTCVKPSGNASVLLGTSSGIHGDHAPKYFRHVQFNKDSEISKLFMSNFAEMCEDSAWNKERDVVVAFPIVSNPDSIFKKDLLGVKQLEYVKKVQDVWIEQGTNYDLCVAPWLKHNVSNTITVPEDGWDEVTDYVYNNRKSFCGISFLAAAGDKAYAQAPFTEVFDHEDIVKKYGQVSLFTSALIEAGLNAFGNNLWVACNTALGYGEDLKEGHEFLQKRDFVRRFHKFAKSFYDFTEEEEKESNNLLEENEYLLALVSETIKKLNVDGKDLEGDELKKLNDSLEGINKDLEITNEKLEANLDRIAELNIKARKLKALNMCADCLKDVYNLHKWWKIQKIIKPIDWANELRPKEYVDINTLGAQACSGGACEVAW